MSPLAGKPFSGAGNGVMWRSGDRARARLNCSKISGVSAGGVSHFPPVGWLYPDYPMLGIARQPYQHVGPRYLGALVDGARGPVTNGIGCHYGGPAREGYTTTAVKNAVRKPLEILVFEPSATLYI
jgi:hypothetical protein